LMLTSLWTRNPDLVSELCILSSLFLPLVEWSIFLFKIDLVPLGNYDDSIITFQTFKNIDIFLLLSLYSLGHLLGTVLADTIQAHNPHSNLLVSVSL
jgi:hypothetical protein